MIQKKKLSEVLKSTTSMDLIRNGLGTVGLTKDGLVDRRFFGYKFAPAREAWVKIHSDSNYFAAFLTVECDSSIPTLAYVTCDFKDYKADAVIIYNYGGSDTQLHLKIDRSHNLYFAKIYGGQETVLLPLTGRDDIKIDTNFNISNARETRDIKPTILARELNS